MQGESVDSPANSLNYIIHVNRLPAGLPAPPVATVFLDDNLALLFQSFGQPRINQPPFHDIIHERIKIFFGNKVCPYHFLDNRALILQNTILYYSLRIHIIGCCEFMRISHRFAKFVWSACRSSAQFSIPFSVGYALCDSMRRVLLQ